MVRYEAVLDSALRSMVHDDVDGADVRGAFLRTSSTRSSRGSGGSAISLHDGDGESGLLSTLWWDALSATHCAEAVLSHVLELRSVATQFQHSSVHDGGPSLRVSSTFLPRSLDAADTAPLPFLATPDTLRLVTAAARLQAEFALFVTLSSLRSKQFCEELVPVVVQPLLVASAGSVPTASSALGSAAPTITTADVRSTALSRLFRFCELLGVTRCVRVCVHPLRVVAGGCHG